MICVRSRVPYTAALTANIDYLSYQSCDIPIWGVEPAAKRLAAKSALGLKETNDSPTCGFKENPSSYPNIRRTHHHELSTKKNWPFLLKQWICHLHLLSLIPILHLHPLLPLRKNQGDSMSHRLTRSNPLQAALLCAKLSLPAVIRPITLSQYQTRRSSHSPMGATTSNPRKKVTINTLRTLHHKQEPITMITAHDFPSAHVADAAGMDMILVGDSLAMVALGMEDTSEVVLEEMILHCRSVARATKSAFTVRHPSLDHYCLCSLKASQ